MNRNITPMDIEFMGGCFDVDLWQGAPIMVPDKLSQLENDVGFITLADIPPIPTKTSELINDSGFITLASVPTKLSAFTNDVGYITINDIPPIPEISEDDITNGTSSISGLISGRRAKKAVETFAPVTDVKVNGTSVLNSGVAEIELTGESDVLYAEFNSTTYQEVDEAYHNGDVVVAFIEDSTDIIGFFELFKFDSTNSVYTFKRRNGAVTYTLTVDDTDTWSASYGTMDTGDLTNNAGYIKSPNVVYCTCATARGTTAKVATIVSGTLTTLNVGDQAIVKFTNSNTSASPTLKIGNTDAKSIMRYGTTVPSASAETSWNAGSPVLFVYDGTYWQMCGYLNSVYYEISDANITNATGSTAGLVTGRRAKSAVEEFAPVKDVQVNGTSVLNNGIAQIPEIPTLVSDLENDSGFITHDEIFTNLGVVDPEPYDDDIYAFLNTLTESGWYTFLWNNGDDYTYFVQVQSFESNGATYVNQHYWGNEEGIIAEYIREFLVEDGEVVDEIIDNYMTFESANNAFASKGHVHYKTDSKALSVWDYCNGSQIRMQNDSPILYTDTLNNRQYLIDTWLSIRQPTYNFQKVTDLMDGSVFYQRSGRYQAGVTTWGDWYKFTGTVFTP